MRKGIANFAWEKDGTAKNKKKLEDKIDLDFHANFNFE